MRVADEKSVAANNDSWISTKLPSQEEATDRGANCTLFFSR